MSKKCSYCLDEIRPGARKCHRCGEWLNENLKDGIKTRENQANNTPSPLIIGLILFGLLVFFIGSGFLIYIFWGKIAEHIPEKAIYNYKCETSGILQTELNKNISIICEKNNPIIKIQYKDKDILTLDGPKLLEKCGKDQICDKENAIKIINHSGTGGFIIENNFITKNPSLYILSFVNKPNEAQKIQSLKSIFENYTLKFGDSVYIHVLGTPQEPLVLGYKIPGLSLEIFNKEKNHEKTIILGLTTFEEKNDEFNYKKTLTFFNKSQFETLLATYLSGIKIKNRDSVVLFDYINDAFAKVKNEKFEQKYYSFYINSYPIFPTIGYGRELNEWSCNSWKNMALKYNKDVDARYKRCWDSGRKGCVRGSKISLDYSYTYLSNISNLYPTPSQGNSIIFIDIPGYDIEKIQDTSCKAEISDTLGKIKSNLITSPNP